MRAGRWGLVDGGWSMRHGENARGAVEEKRREEKGGEEAELGVDGARRWGLVDGGSSMRHGENARGAGELIW